MNNEKNKKAEEKLKEILNTNFEDGPAKIKISYKVKKLNKKAKR